MPVACAFYQPTEFPSFHSCVPVPAVPHSHCPGSYRPGTVFVPQHLKSSDPKDFLVTKSLSLSFGLSFIFASLAHPTSTITVLRFSSPSVSVPRHHPASHLFPLTTVLLTSCFWRLDCNSHIPPGFLLEECPTPFPCHWSFTHDAIFTFSAIFFLQHQISKNKNITITRRSVKRYKNAVLCALVEVGTRITSLCD